MSIIKEAYQISGMRQDNLVGTGVSNRFAHEIKNMRLNTVGDYTTAAWTTEEGTLEYSVNWETDWLNNKSLNDIHLIGQAIINDIWILFGTFDGHKNKKLSINPLESAEDIIIKLWFDNNILRGALLYKGNLNFDKTKPIETITYYENDKIQKVYWTDGVNQPRMINITKSYTPTTQPVTPPTEDLTLRYPTTTIETQFDFTKEVSLNENVTIVKKQTGNGQFPAGTVKYAITYYTKYGQESNIVYTSRLYYPIKGDRGCAPEELSGDIFEITVSELDITHNFDYIRLYSIVRTTNNSTPIVRIVGDIEIPSDGSSVVFVDSNTTGEIIDPTILNYVGGRDLVAQTFEQKDNTLFLGNIKLNDKSINKLDTELSLNWNLSANNGIFVLDTTNKHTIQHTLVKSGVYPWTNQLNSDTSPKIFKYGETYRFGIQFQDNKGNWSDVKILTDATNTQRPNTSLTDINNNFGIFKYTLPSSIVNTLYAKGFKKARLVCCFPTNSDRTILAQGILCPTMTNSKWSETNSPNYMSSWFQRFAFYPNNQSYEVTNELQSMRSSDTVNPMFGTNRHVITFHSPELEFDESIRTLDWSNIKLRLVGVVRQTSYTGKLYIDYSKQAEDYSGNKGLGLLHNNSVKTYDSDGVLNNYLYGSWNDIDVYNSNYVSGSSSKYQDFAITYDFRVFPFQRNHLGNYMGQTDIVIHKSGTSNDFTVKDSSILEAKVFSTLRQSFNTIYYPYQELTLNDCQVFDSNGVIPIKLKDGKIYYGNVNSIAPIGNNLRKSAILKYQGLNPPHTTNVEGEGSVQESDKITTFNGYYSISEDVKYVGTNSTWPVGVSSDPVMISYKSTPHCVIQLANDNVMPQFYNYGGDFIRLYGGKETWIAELYRDIDANTRFGGPINSTNSLNNIFIPCSKAYNLVKNIALPMFGTEGDHYYMRYDNLKTYPYAPEDVNQIVDITSFMCETRINLDGRYDKNRGLIDNTIISNTNFNYINNSYTQQDNFFSYKKLDELSSSLNLFNNQITWTKTKLSGEDIDLWTNLTLASVADADGTVGQINKIINLDNSLYIFQDHGIARIGYNERTAITTENGVPLEIANSNKFTGFSYLTKEVGCQNKWSISSSKNGVMFIDSSRREIDLLSESVQSLSTANGFDAFMIQNLTNASILWNPFEFNNFVTYYDKLGKDIYYINNNYCIAWNEDSKTFTSFYDYVRVPYMTNIGQHLMMFKNGKFWAARESNLHSHFFGSYKPYWITLVCDGSEASIPNSSQSGGTRSNTFPLDKIFNNIEYRADIYDRISTSQRVNINLPIFSDIAAWNGYQLYKEFPINSVRKFNIWRATLPRATYMDPNGNLYTNRDRIRNPFCYIKLVNNNPSNISNGHRVILHDLDVYYDMK